MLPLPLLYCILPKTAIQKETITYLGRCWKEDLSAYLIVIIWYKCNVSGSSLNQSLSWGFTFRFISAIVISVMLHDRHLAHFLGESARFLINKSKSISGPNINISLQRNKRSAWRLPSLILQSKCEDRSGGWPGCCLPSVAALFAYTEHLKVFIVFQSLHIWLSCSFLLKSNY